MAAQFLERRRFAPAGPAGERARENGAVVFGIVGRLAKEKHHERVLRHASAIRNAGGQLVVIGDGPEREALGAFKDAVFVGWQAGEALIAWYRKLDYLVMAADSDTLGLVLLEAAGCGTPAVALKGTVAGDYLERRMSGMAVERFSPELFHELIATARTDVYSRMCAEALALADDHDITRGTRTLLDVWGKQASARERSRQRRPELARVLKGCNPVVAAPSRRGLML
jgi:glycosyltransferase involved in cell wall biosynthesis